MKAVVDRLLLWVLTLAIVFSLICSTIYAFGEEANSCYSHVHSAIQKLQPWYYSSSDPVALSHRSEHLDVLSRAICNASDETGIDPLLAVAIAFRESSLHPIVGSGARDGERGEQGYFQVMPGGPALRFSPLDCSQHEPGCNAKTALRFMSFLRERCEDTWSWVAAYGRGSGCPSRSQAKEWTEVRVARGHLCKIGDCDEIWPE